MATWPAAEEYKKKEKADLTRKKIGITEFSMYHRLKEEKKVITLVFLVTYALSLLQTFMSEHWLIILEIMTMIATTASFLPRCIVAVTMFVLIADELNPDDESGTREPLGKRERFAIWLFGVITSIVGTDEKDDAPRSVKSSQS